MVERRSDEWLRRRFERRCGAEFDGWSECRTGESDRQAGRFATSNYRFGHHLSCEIPHSKGHQAQKSKEVDFQKSAYKAQFGQHFYQQAIRPCTSGQRLSAIAPNEWFVARAPSRASARNSIGSRVPASMSGKTSASVVTDCTLHRAANPASARPRPARGRWRATRRGSPGALFVKRVRQRQPHLAAAVSAIRCAEITASGSPTPERNLRMALVANSCSDTSR